MNILFITEEGKTQAIDTDILPRTGDLVDMFNGPIPSVKHVLLYPRTDRLRKLGLKEGQIDAIVTLWRD